MRCPYCHNPDLVLPERFITKGEQEGLTAEFLAYIRKRKHLLDGVVFSGGEPLLQKGLQELLLQLKKEGFAIKLDTNGLLPLRLGALLKQGLLDYVALDYKCHSGAWQQATGAAPALVKESQYQSWQESLSKLEKAPLIYELRTTLIRGLHSREDILLMGHELAALIKRAAPTWYLQTYEGSQKVLAHYQNKRIDFSPYSKEEMAAISTSLKQIIPTVELRY